MYLPAIKDCRQFCFGYNYVNFAENGGDFPPGNLAKIKFEKKYLTH